MELKEKMCKGQNKAVGVSGCGKKTKYRTFGLCNDCLSDFLFDTDKGKLIMQSRIIPKAKSIVKSEQKAKDKVARNKLKTLGQYEAEAKTAFQRWIRFRDENQSCISCGGNDKDLWDGGHFKKAEIYSGLIFDERNCHKQCRKCNRYLGGNEGEYRIGLVKRMGEQFVLSLENDANETRNRKYTKQELIDLKALYDLKLKNSIK